MNAVLSLNLCVLPFFSFCSQAENETLFHLINIYKICAQLSITLERCLAIISFQSKISQRQRKMFDAGTETERLKLKANKMAANRHTLRAREERRHTTPCCIKHLLSLSGHKTHQSSAVSYIRGDFLSHIDRSVLQPSNMSTVSIQMTIGHKKNYFVAIIAQNEQK